MGEKSAARCHVSEAEQDTDEVDVVDRSVEAAPGVDPVTDLEQSQPASHTESVQRSAADDGSGSATADKPGFTSYDPGPDRHQLGAEYGLDFVKDGQAARIQRLASTMGTDRVKQWADEGMTIETMGKPKDMAAFRKRQANRSEAIPADIERQNQASVQRNTGPAGAAEAAGTGANGPAIRRATEEGSEGGRHAGSGGVPTAVRDVISSPGQSLDESVQREMEDSLGGDFGDVRLHTGPRAANAAEQIDARAFTVGNHVAFNRGEYDPGSEAGQKVLAHELTHVRQQTGGELSMLPKAGAMQIDPDPALEREAEAAEQAVADGGATTVHRMGAAMHVQRSPDDDDDADSEEEDEPEGDILDGLAGEDLDEAEVVEALLHRVLQYEVGESLFEELAGVESEEEAQSAIESGIDSDALEVLEDAYARYAGIPERMVDFEIVLSGFEAGEAVGITALPVTSIAPELPARPGGFGDAGTAVVRLSPYVEEDDSVPDELQPFLDAIRNEDLDATVLDFDEMRLEEGPDGPVWMSDPEGDIDMDPEEALEAAFDAFMASETGQQLEEKAEELGEQAQEKVEELWEESWWGRAAIAGVVVAALGGLYIAEEDVPEDAVEWVEENLELEYEGDSFSVSFEPEIDGISLGGSDHVDFDTLGGKLEAAYQIGEETEAEAGIEFVDEDDARELEAEFGVEGESWEVGGEAEYDEDEHLNVGLGTEMSGEDWEAEMEAEIDRINEGLDETEGAVGAEYSGENLGLEGSFDWEREDDETHREGELGVLYGEEDEDYLGGSLELRDVEEDSAIVTGLEAGRGGDLWQVDASGELEFSSEGHRWMAQAGLGLAEEDEWDLGVEGMIEDYSMEEMRQGLSLEGNYYGDNLTLSGSGEYRLTQEGHRELESSLEMTLSAANRLELQARALAERTAVEVEDQDAMDMQTRFGGELEATINHLEHFQTDVGASYQRVVGGESEWKIETEHRYQLDQVDLHLTNTFNDEEFQVLFGGSINF